MDKKECPTCKQISETPFCPYCGTKLQLTGEEGELKEKEDLRLALEEAIAIGEEAIAIAEGESPPKQPKKRWFRKRDLPYRNSDGSQRPELRCEVSQGDR